MADIRASVGTSERREHGEALIVEWYRLDQTAHIVRTLVIAALVLAPGSLLVATSIAPLTFPHASARFLGAGSAPVAMMLLGFAMVIAGPLIAISGLKRVIEVDAFIALRLDGVLVHLPGRAELVRWGDVTEVLYDAPSSCIALVRGEQEPFFIMEKLAGIEPEAFAKRLKEVHRKALFGVLRVTA